MTTSAYPTNPPGQNFVNEERASSDPNSEILWEELYASLRPLAKRFVYSFRVSDWHGQEHDIVEDVVQESARRILERSRRAECGETTPIYSLEHIVWSIVRNYCIDLSRRDHRLVRIISDEKSFEGCSAIENHLDLTEEAIENVQQEELFTLLASEIAKFPDKQRRALLIDLANRMSFDTEPTPLQKAFMDAGIRIEEYKLTLPKSYIDRSRHASLLSFAYNRIAQLLTVQEFIHIA